jgi:magnesium transporter
MKFELTREFFDHFKKLVEDVSDREIRNILEELHPADIAEILDELDDDDSLFVYKLLDKEKAADVFIELSEDARENLAQKLSAREIAEEVIDRLDSDDAADFMNELPEAFKEQIISHIEDQNVASDLIDLLTYEEGTAGALMAKELIRVNQNWSVATCLREMRRQAEDIDNIYTIYVVDDKGVLIGTLSLKKLLLSAASTRSLIRELYDQKDLHTVQPFDAAEDVANIMEKYDLVVLPVVNESGILLGRITIDDVVDLIRKEAEKDYQMASGLSEDVEESDSSWLIIRARLPWLIIGLFGGILGASVINLYEEDISFYPEMAFFIPMIAAMGGNVGVQSAAIIVQGLANQSISLSSTSQKLIKELGIAAINGLILAAMVLIYNLSFLDSLALSYAVSISMLAVIIVASLFGTMIPLLLDRFKIDPALATGPFITTINDIIGLFIYFMVGRLMYKHFEHGESVMALLF